MYIYIYIYMCIYVIYIYIYMSQFSGLCDGLGLPNPTLPDLSQPDLI